MNHVAQSTDLVVLFQPPVVESTPEKNFTNRIKVVKNTGYYVQCRVPLCYHRFLQSHVCFHLLLNHAIKCWAISVDVSDVNCLLNLFYPERCPDLKCLLGLHPAARSPCNRTWLQCKEIMKLLNTIRTAIHHQQVQGMSHTMIELFNIEHFTGLHHVGGHVVGS